MTTNQTINPLDIRRFIPAEELASFKSDAQKILGLIPAPNRDPRQRYEDAMNGKSEYLVPPPPGDPIRELAELWLTLKPGEAAEIWVTGVGISYANIPQQTGETGTKPAGE